MDRSSETVRKYCKISCSNVPEELLEKNAARLHFRKFGRVIRMHLKPKSRICQIEYCNEESAQLASLEGQEYKGQTFNIVWGVDSPPKKKRPRKEVDPDWVPDDPDVKAELEALAAVGDYPVSPKRRLIRRAEAMIVDPSPQILVKKSKRKWKSDAEKEKPSRKVPLKSPTTKSPKSTKSPSKKSTTSEQLELLKILRQPALTIEEKFRVLDARDKLIRLRTKKQSDLSKAKVTVGTCPDMCPEKERLLREVQHQVAIYEQEADGRGMNQKLAVKQYSRSSADQEVPLPHELRPVRVLQLTMSYLVHQIMDMCESPEVNLAEWYHFLWDRTRSIRKDITQQELCCLGSVELVEQCARFHIHCSARLVAEDPSVCDQKINTENLTKCLQSLKYMYHDLNLKNIKCPNEAEFRAYVILLNLNDGNFMWELQQLRPEIQKSPEIRFALKVYSAIDKNNYVRFFKLVHSTTYLNACILLRYFVQVRLRALRTILKSYSLRAPNTQFPLQELMKVLAFEDVPSTIEFLEYYGLHVNEERTRVVLDRKSFYSPELPFVLDRAINVVESKRRSSVGKIICGGFLPEPSFKNHKPHDSFNDKGLIDISEFVSDSDIRKLEKSKKAEPKSVATGQSVFGEVSSSKNIFAPPVFHNKPFDAKVPKSMSDTVDSPLKKNKPVESTQMWSFKNINEQQNTEVPQTVTSTIFGKPGEAVSLTKSIFGSPTAMEVQPFSFAPKVNIFGNQKVESGKFSIFQTATEKPSIFGGFPATAPPPSSKPPGGFKFDLDETPKREVLDETSETEVLEEPKVDKKHEEVNLEDQRIKLQQQLEEERRKLEERKKEAEEAMRRKEEERRIAEQKALEEKRKQEEERRRKMEEEKRLMEEMRRKKEEEKRRREIEERRKRELEERRRKIAEEQRRIAEQKRKEEEERRKMREIEKFVAELMRDMLNKVEENLKNEKLEEISRHVKNWKLSLFLRKWHAKTEFKKWKRKVMEQSPAWISCRSIDQEAKELYTDMQELNLSDVKRYKTGKPSELRLPKELQIEKIDMRRPCECLLKNYGTKPQKEVFWKVTISLPDFREAKYGTNFVEDVLKKCLDWQQDKYGNTLYVTQTKLYNTTVTCCLERRQGVRNFDCESNGLMFVARSCNSILIARLKESVKKFGKNVSVPVCVLLCESHDDDNLVELKNVLNEEERICEYNISKLRPDPLCLVQSIEENLSILALFSKPPPPLRLNTLHAFLKENLCTDLWKYVASYAKWNNMYKRCLKRPNVVINLYNEGLKRIKEIATADNNKEYHVFPEEFQDYLRSKIPELLPCDYKYFPKFWCKDTYMLVVTNEIDSLTLPQYDKTWPPVSDLELERNIFDYCNVAFPQNDKIFYKLMATILEHFDPNENFDEIENVSWVDLIEILALEKLETANFSLRNTEFYSRSIYNQLIVVYNVDDLDRFTTEPWFYVRNPSVACEMKTIGRSLASKPSKRTQEVQPSDNFKIDFDLEETLNKSVQKSYDEEHEISEKKATLRDLETLMADLEESMAVQRRINEKFQDTIRLVLGDI